MGVECRRQDCTVEETGVCLLNNEPATCPERADEGDVEGVVQPVDEEQKTHMPPSRACGLVEARELMADRYVHVVGILGEPNAGKTAALVSLYLLMAHNKLCGFTFRDSRTLMGFEEISRGARCWNRGQLPDQITGHTKRADDREAGFLHIRVNSNARNVDIDFLLPDLPGEWTSALIDRKRVDRLEFLKRADAIWLMVNGAELGAVETRQATLHRTQLILQRLAGFLETPPTVILVVTRLDESVADPNDVADLCKVGAEQGLDMKVAPIASVSDVEEVEPGQGIAELLASTIQGPTEGGVLWPDLGLEATFIPPRVRSVGGVKS